MAGLCWKQEGTGDPFRKDVGHFMKLTNKGWINPSDARDARVEALEELISGLRRFPEKLRLMRQMIARQLSVENDPTVRAPVRPVRRAA
jgi:hypothetical protein